MSITDLNYCIGCGDKLQGQYYYIYDYNKSDPIGPYCTKCSNITPSVDSEIDYNMIITRFCPSCGSTNLTDPTKHFTICGNVYKCKDCNLSFIVTTRI